MKAALALTLAVLAACAAPAPFPPASSTGQEAVVATAFSGAIRPRGTTRSNQVIARDILDLAFQIESGQPLGHLLRFEGPVGVFIAPAFGALAHRDLEALLARLRSEAGIEMSRVADPENANIVVEQVPPAGLARAVPGAACFLAPQVASWAEYAGLARGNRPRWTGQTSLTRIAVFIPSGIPPQEVRDCLHEEIAQALGPVNDLYRLSDSVFNDDNMHSVLTAFDMTVLRALYAPELSAGMARAEVAARLPAVLARVNPEGQGLPPRPPGAVPQGWQRAIEAALSRTSGDAARKASGQSAVAMARTISPADHRLALSDLALGRLLLEKEPERAAALFFEAYDISSRGDDPVRAAHAGLHVGVIALSLGQFDAALEFADRHLPAAMQAENATLVSGFEAIRAEAFARLGRSGDAASARSRSLRWAAYAFGDPRAIERAQAEIAGLAGEAP